MSEYAGKFRAVSLGDDLGSHIGIICRKLHILRKYLYEIIVE